MAKQTIDITTPHPGWTGDPFPTAFGKANANFDELYEAVGSISTIVEDVEQLKTEIEEKVDTALQDVDEKVAQAEQQLDQAIATIPGQVDTAIAGRIPGRNRLINGNFSVAQRATNKPVVDTGYNPQYHCLDRWYMASAGTLMAMSQQVFPSGQTDVPGNPSHFMRVGSITSNAPTGLAYTGQTIEDVRTFSGTASVLSFWAKASSARKLGISTVQYFGAGGSGDTNQVWPTVDLTTTWQKYTVQISLPSVAGKTMGANNHVRLRLWIDVGSTYTNIAGDVGSHSGDVDIALVQWEDGTVATGFEFEHVGAVLQLCQRYCRKFAFDAGSAFTMALALDASTGIGWLDFGTMRTIPTARIAGGLQMTGGGPVSSPAAPTLLPSSPENMAMLLVVQGKTPGAAGYFNPSAGGAIIFLEAEL